MRVNKCALVAEKSVCFRKKCGFLMKNTLSGKHIFASVSAMKKGWDQWIVLRMKTNSSNFYTTKNVPRMISMISRMISILDTLSNWAFIGGFNVFLPLYTQFVLILLMKWLTTQLFSSYSEKLYWFLRVFRRAKSRYISAKYKGSADTIK